MRLALVFLLLLPACALAQEGEKLFTAPHAVLEPMGDPAAVTVLFDVGLLRPKLEGQARTASRLIRSVDGPVFLPLAGQSAAVSPRLMVEGLLDPGLGSVRAGFRCLGSDGTALIPGNGPGEEDQRLRTVLDLNDAMLAYLSPCLFGQGLRAGVGLRVADVFFSSKAVGFPTLESHVGSFCIGAGPVALGEWSGQFGQTPLGWRVAGGGGPLFGQIRQRFYQERQGRTSVSTGRLDTRFQAHTFSTAGGEAGLTWSPASLGLPLTLTAAYSWEQWWQVGRVGLSDARLTLQGLILRAELSF
jgi:hypothetical protein